MSDQYTMGGLAAQDQYDPNAVDWSRMNQPFGVLQDTNPVEYKTASPLVNIRTQDIADATDKAMAFSGGGLSTRPVMAPEMGLGSVPQGTFKNWLLRHDPAGGDPVLVDQSGQTGNAFTSLKGGMHPSQMTRDIINEPAPYQYPGIDIADLQRRNAELVFGPTDRMYAGGDLAGAGGVKFENPIAQEGGVNFPHMHRDVPIPGMPDDVAPLYASVSKSASTKTNKTASEVLERGGEPWYVPLMMSHGAGDSSKQMVGTVRQALKQAEPSSDAITKINESIIANLPENLRSSFRGYGDAGLDEWLNRGLKERAAFTKAMDTKKVKDVTGVDVAAMRYANTDPRLLHTPSGSGGIIMGRMRPDVGVTDAPLHSNYPYTFMGQRGEIGGAPGNMPFSLLGPDMHRALVPRTNQGVSLATTPAIQVMQGLASGVPKTQKVTQEVVDNWGEWFRRHPQGWTIPPAAAGMGALAAQDEYQ